MSADSTEDLVEVTYQRMREVAMRWDRSGKRTSAAAPRRRVVSTAKDDGLQQIRGVRGLQKTGPDGRRLPKALNIHSLKNAVATTVTQNGWESPLARGWVMNHWDVLVGEKVAQHTKVEKFKDDVVFVSCDSTAWASNLRLMQRQLLQRIAEKIGPDQIRELKFYGPTQPSWRKGRLHVKGRGPRDTYG